METRRLPSGLSNDLIERTDIGRVPCRCAEIDATEFVSPAARWPPQRIRYRTETLEIWSATEPVRALSGPSPGPLQNRLYSYTMWGAGMSNRLRTAELSKRGEQSEQVLVGSKVDEFR